MKLLTLILCVFLFVGCDSHPEDTGGNDLVGNVEFIESPDKLIDLTKKYEGYVLYVDIWASWCGPCMREMKPAHELKSKFSTTDKIKFIYINSSDSENRWKAAIDVKKITGINFQANKTLFNDLRDNYEMTSYPRYIIFGKEGKLVNGNAPRPSDAETKKILRNLL